MAGQQFIRNTTIFHVEEDCRSRVVKKERQSVTILLVVEMQRAIHSMVDHFASVMMDIGEMAMYAWNQVFQLLMIRFIRTYGALMTFTLTEPI
jgi:hypothetical protein